MLNSFGQGSVRSLSEEVLLSMTVSSESVCVDKELESRSLKSGWTLSMNSRMISVSGTDGMTLMMARSLIEEVELKLTNVPPKSISLYYSLMPPVSLHASLTCSMSSSKLSGTSGRSILSELSSLNKMRSRMGFAILTDQVASQHEGPGSCFNTN